MGNDFLYKESDISYKKYAFVFEYCVQFEITFKSQASLYKL